MESKRRKMNFPPEAKTLAQAATVMVVDDDPVFCKLMDSWLTRLGYFVRTALSADEALDIARSVGPDVAVVDLILPGADGFQLMGALKDMFPHSPLVAITGARERDMVVQAFDRGASAFLHKPLELNTLEATLHRCLQLGNMFTSDSSNPALSSLLELQHAIVSGLPIDRLLHLLLQEMIRYTQADAASLLLLEPDGNNLRIAASYGLCDNAIQDQRIAIGERISGWVMQHNEPQVVIGDASTDPRLDGVIRSVPASVGMCLPMRGKEQVLGVLCLTRSHDDRPFTRDAIDLGMLLAGEVARVLERTAAAEEQLDFERSLMRRDKLVTIGELASGVAHEINNPLGYVSSNVASLKEYLDEILPIMQALALSGTGSQLESVIKAAQEVDLDFILTDLPVCIRETQEGVGRVLKIVADLKIFSRDDADTKEMGDINQILDGAVNILWNQIKYKAELTRDYGSLPTLRCYPSRLGQVFLNLLHNAAQSIEREGEIFLRTAYEDGRIIVEVQDNGEGMAPDLISKIFEPFYTTKPRGVGTGLGLSIARRIVDLHAGSLEVASIMGQGSTFRVVIPVPPDEPGGAQSRMRGAS